MFVECRVDAKKYIIFIEERLLPSIAVMHGVDWVSKQDNAPIYLAIYTRRYFSTNCICVLEWPVRSLSLNPIDNLWSILVLRVYANTLQFDNLSELKAAICAI